jgi:hypothetical protein
MIVCFSVAADALVFRKYADSSTFLATTGFPLASDVDVTYYFSDDQRSGFDVTQIDNFGR